VCPAGRSPHRAIGLEREGVRTIYPPFMSSHIVLEFLPPSMTIPEAHATAWDSCIGSLIHSEEVDEMPCLLHGNEHANASDTYAGQFARDAWPYNLATSLRLRQSQEFPSLTLSHSEKTCQADNGYAMGARGGARREPQHICHQP
jgi:hypothetical protein